MKKIDLADLVPMDVFTDKYPILIDLVYSQPNHKNNHFGLLYSEKSKLWCHREIAKVTLLAACKLNEHCNWRLMLFDCMRTHDAQEKMATKGFDSSLVSTPGSGAHPRAMAIDVQPIDTAGTLIDMGTPFDFFSDDLSKNPAARNYTKFKNISDTFLFRSRRDTLETAFRWAATVLDHCILPLPQEWWDFRFEDKISLDYQPLGETDLPSYMKLIHTSGKLELARHQDAINDVFQAVDCFR